MKDKQTRPYFRRKGFYKDGRMRVVIEWREGRDVKSCALPKPEVLIKIIGQVIKAKQSPLKRTNI